MKKKVNITIKDYDVNENLFQIREINIENKAEIKHLEDNKIGIIDGIRDNSISVLWNDNSRESFNFNELDKLEYTILNRQKLFTKQIIDHPQLIPDNNSKKISYDNKECISIDPTIKSDIDIISPEAEALVILKNIKESKDNTNKNINIEDLQKVSEAISNLDWTTLSKQF
jgi:hypothetical protein